MADKGNRKQIFRIKGQIKERRKVLLDPTGRITGYRVEKRTSGGTIWKRVKFSTERRTPSSSSEVMKSKPARTKKMEHMSTNRRCGTNSTKAIQNTLCLQSGSDEGVGRNGD